MVIDADLAKLVDYHGNAPAVLGSQDSIEKGGFSGSEKACKNRNGHSLFVHGLRALEFPLRLFSKSNNEPTSSQRLTCAAGFPFREDDPT
jgi:hypothetical protein